MIEVFIWSVLYYASEMWCLAEKDIQRPDAMEMWIWRKMKTISWTEHVRYPMKRFYKKLEKTPFN